MAPVPKPDGGLATEPAARMEQAGGQDDQPPAGPTTPGQSDSASGNAAGGDGNGVSTPGSHSSPDETPAGALPEAQPAPQPRYESTPAISPVAHKGITHFDATIFMGIDAKQAPPFIRITAIQPNTGDGQPSSATLILGKGTPGEKVLSAGDVIARADFDKLSWDASASGGGRFSFVPLDAGQQPIAQVPVQTIEVHAHPEPPRYPDPSTTLPQPVAHDAVLSFNALTFTGLDPGKAPAAVRITRIDTAGAAEPDRPALVLVKPDGTQIPLTENATLRAEDFSRVQWRTAGNEGGSFSFQPLVDDGQPLAGSTVQTVSVTKHPPPPSYDDKPPVIEVGPDRQLTFDAALFIGQDATRKPAGIRILAIDARDPSSPGAAALTLDGHAEPVAAGWFIRAEDFDKLRWDAGLNQGGSFRFIPANVDGTPILGASPQAVLIEEASPLPAYEPYLEIWITHDATVAVDSSLLLGKNRHAEPFSIRLGDIYGDDYPTESALKWRDGDSLKPGALIHADQFDQLVWRGDLATGGYFFFTPVSPDGTELEGAAEARINIRESVRPSVYPDPMPSFGVVHDDLTPLPVEKLAGIEEERYPARILIDAITPLNPEGEHPALWLIDGENRTPVRVDDVIEQSDLPNLHWDSRHNTGGTVVFRPLDGASDFMLTPSSEVVQPTLHIHELPPASQLLGKSGSAVETDMHLTTLPGMTGKALSDPASETGTTHAPSASIPTTEWPIPWKGVDASILLDGLS